MVAINSMSWEIEGSAAGTPGGPCILWAAGLGVPVEATGLGMGMGEPMEGIGLRFRGGERGFETAASVAE